MGQALALVSLVVREYAEALDFYVGTLGFTVVEDTPVAEQNKRWVVVEPPGTWGARLLLARASSPDFWRDYENYRAKGVKFVRGPTEEPHGMVAVFTDLYGNLWDLVQPRP